MKKAKIILTIITIILICIVIFLAILVFQKYVLKKNFEEDILSFADKNQSTIFTVDSVTLFSRNSPKLGEPSLYFKSINDFAKSDIIEENRITDSFEFTISSSDEADLNTPTLYNNLANPLTFSYVDANIKPDYTITDVTSPITYDGSLLKKCNINLEDIQCTLSFDIHITNNLDEDFKTTVFIDIPLSSGEETIFDGSITNKQDTNYTFYRYN